jgi:hypothetical protein
MDGVVETAVMVSPAGEKRTVTVKDPKVDLVPLMAQGWSQWREEGEGAHGESE